MRFVSPVLKRVVYPALAKTGYLRHCATRGPLSVVTYHGVLPQDYSMEDSRLDGSWVTADSFRRQLQLLRKNYNVVSPDQVRLWCRGEEGLPERAVLLTCDDGLANCVTDMLPVLLSEGVTCLFFVTAASLSDTAQMLWYEDLYLTMLHLPEGALKGTFCGVPIDEYVNSAVSQRHSSWHNLVQLLSTREPEIRVRFARSLRDTYGLDTDWDSRYLRKHPNRFRMLASEEVRTVLAAGMSIGSHTLTHPKLSQLSADLSEREIVESRSHLQKLLGVPIWSIAYPFGGVDAVSPRELEIAERAGYDCAFVNFAGGFGSELPRFALPRVHVSLDMSLAEFEGHVCGLHEQMRRRFGVAERFPS